MARKPDPRFRTPLVDRVLPHLDEKTHEAAREVLHRIAGIVAGVGVATGEMEMCSRCDRIYRRPWPERCECGAAFVPRAHPESDALRAAVAAAMASLVRPGASVEDIWRAALFAVGGWLMDEASPTGPPRAKFPFRDSFEAHGAQLVGPVAARRGA